MTATTEFTSNSVEETLLIGRRIGETLQPGDVIGLVGQLGAGKTHLVKGIAAGLGVANDRLVNSPTFVLVNEYAGRVDVHHVDAYRLQGAHELEAIGFEETCRSGGVMLVEWADKVVAAMPAGALWIDIAVTGEASRRLKITTDSADLAARVRGAALDRS